MNDNPVNDMLALDCRQFFSVRAATLMELTHYFGYSCDPDLIEAIVNGPLFGRDAKIDKKSRDEGKYLNEIN